jgi:hypothetical protein
LIELARERWPGLRERFGPERPGPLVGPHAIATGCHAISVDRWPEPRLVMARVGGNVALRGDPDALGPDAFPAGSEALVDAAPGFLQRLRSLRPDVLVWDRVVYALPGAPRIGPTPDAEVRRLGSSDATALERLEPQIAWVCDTFDGPQATAASGLAWGSFVAGELASLAVPFFVGERYEDLGVVTESRFRGRGLNPACAGRLAQDVIARGRTPSWTTSPDNLPSRRVAEKLGFQHVRDDVLYLVGMEIPGVASPGAH